VLKDPALRGPVLKDPVLRGPVTRKGRTVPADPARPEAIAVRTDAGERTVAAAPKVSVLPTVRAMRAARKARPGRAAREARAGQAPVTGQRGPRGPKALRGIKTAGKRAAPREYAGSMTKEPGGPSARTGGRGRTNRT
jgi:hypothetical protein